MNELIVCRSCLCALAFCRCKPEQSTAIGEGMMCCDSSTVTGSFIDSPSNESRPARGFWRNLPKYRRRSR